MTVASASTEAALGLTPPPYALYRQIRRDPTIALVRSAIIAAVVDIPYKVKADEAAPAGAVPLVERELRAWRDEVVERAASTGVDFGWASWEIVGEVVKREWRFKKIKALLHDITTIELTDQGDFSHLEQAQGDVIWNPKPPIVVDAADAMLISWRVEGSNLYGEPLLVNAREVFQSWRDTEAGAHRYDIKIAGSQIVIHFPRGEGRDKNGRLVDNAVLAEAVGDKLESAGIVKVEAESVDAALKGVVGEQPAPGWSFEILKNPNQQPQFVSRLVYLDKLKARALGWPERAVLEASTGTRADAATHASFAILNLEMMAKHIARDISRQLLDRLLEENYGADARGTVRIESGLLQDPSAGLLAQLAREVLKAPDGAARLDWDRILDEAGIPRREVEAVA